MAANNDSLNEAILIKRAKRRLIGALTILMILFALSIFFLQDRTKVQELNKDVKVSFMEMSGYEIVQSSEVFFKTENSFKADEFNLHAEKKQTTPKKIYLIQVGIFNNETNAKKLRKSIEDLGLNAEIEIIEFNGEEKVKLVTETFDNQSEAKQALLKIKQANLPGMIKAKEINDIH